MPEITTLSIQFNQRISARDIHRFRAAVIEKTERASALFHNHKGDHSFHYRYPNIQYKVCNGLPTIVCLQDGVEEINTLLEKDDLKMSIGNRELDFKIRDLKMRVKKIGISGGLEHYSLSKWMALNQKHIVRWKALQGDDKAQKEFLESILTGNILSFAKGVDYRIEERLLVKITNLSKPFSQSFKGRNVLLFNIEFVANIQLPNWIGLGKGTSIGFGTIELK